MNLTLEQLYKLRHALNVATVYDPQKTDNSDIVSLVILEIKDEEFELENSLPFNT